MDDFFETLDFFAFDVDKASEAAKELINEILEEVGLVE